MAKKKKEKVIVERAYLNALLAKADFLDEFITDDGVMIRWDTFKRLSALNKTLEKTNYLFEAFVEPTVTQAGTTSSRTSSKNPQPVLS